MNNIINQKVKRKENIFTTFIDIISRNKQDIKEEMLSERLEEIYRAQAELGATDSITALERGLENHSISEKKAKKIDKDRMSTKTIISNIENTIQKNTLDQENNIER